MSMLALDLSPLCRSLEDVERVSQECSFVCPNCDGPILVGEHEACGICTDCYFAEAGDQP